MRAVICSLIVGLLPEVCLAETIEFTFTGSIEQNPSPFIPANIWNGSGPLPYTFQMTFDVNTLDPLNTVLDYAFSNSGSPLFSQVLVGSNATTILP
jgi:hypothetical protein